jgi:hypothetical protein
VDRLVEPSNKHPSLDELSSVDPGVLVDLFLLIVHLGGLGHLVWFVGQEHLEGYHILSEVVKYSLSGSLHEILELSTYDFGRVFLFE